MQARSDAWARTAWLAVLPLWVLTTLATAWIQPDIFKNLAARPWSLIFVVVMLGGVWGVFHFRKQGRELAAFLASSAFILGILASTMTGIYPNWLRSTIDPNESLTVSNSAAGTYGLRVALYWWTIGITLVALYFAYVFRSTRGKVGAGGRGAWILSGRPDNAGAPPLPVRIVAPAPRGCSGPVSWFDD